MAHKANLVAKMNLNLFFCVYSKNKPEKATYAQKKSDNPGMDNAHGFASIGAVSGSPF
jgi:hypothetical protein